MASLQVFQTASEKVEAESLAALHALSACLSRSMLSSDTEDLLDSFLSSILQGMLAETPTLCQTARPASILLARDLPSCSI